MEYNIPCTWQMYAICKIKANSLSEAVDRVKKGKLPEGFYIKESFEIDEEVIDYYNPEISEEELNSL